MLKPRRLAIVAVAGTGIALASLAVVHARTTPSRSAAASGGTATGSPTLSPPPAFPAAVLDAPSPASGQVIQAGPFGPPDRCTQQSTHSGIAVDARVFLTVAQLDADSEQVVVADAARQLAYWQQSGGHWYPMTMTQYHVTRVVSGTGLRSGAWVQAADAGASSDAIASCKSLAYVVLNQPLPTVGTEYVLFLHHDPETGQLDAGTLRRFPVINGTVETEAVAHPAASTSVVTGFTAQPLSAFLASLTTHK